MLLVGSADRPRPPRPWPSTRPWRCRGARRKRRRSSRTASASRSGLAQPRGRRHCNPRGAPARNTSDHAALAASRMPRSAARPSQAEGAEARERADRERRARAQPGPRRPRTRRRRAALGSRRRSPPRAPAQRLRQLRDGTGHHPAQDRHQAVDAEGDEGPGPGPGQSIEEVERREQRGGTRHARYRSAVRGAAARKPSRAPARVRGRSIGTAPWRGAEARCAAAALGVPAERGGSDRGGRTPRRGHPNRLEERRPRAGLTATFAGYMPPAGSTVTEMAGLSQSNEAGSRSPTPRIPPSRLDGALGAVRHADAAFPQGGPGMSAQDSVSASEPASKTRATPS